MQRIPPVVTYDEQPERPRRALPTWYVPHYDGEGPAMHEHLLLVVWRAQLLLRPTRRGVDVLLRGVNRWTVINTDAQPLVNVCRGLRAVQAGRNLPRYGYEPIDAGHGEHFVCSLAPGEYFLVQPNPANPDSGTGLWWRDTVGVQPSSSARCEPEVAQLIERGMPQRRPITGQPRLVQRRSIARRPLE
jgi:hypothetical protein